MSGSNPPPAASPDVGDPQTAQASEAAGGSGPYAGYPSYEAYAQAYKAYYGAQYPVPPLDATGGGAGAAAAAAAPSGSAPAAGGSSAAYDYSQYYAGYGYNAASGGYPPQHPQQQQQQQHYPGYPQPPPSSTAAPVLPWNSQKQQTIPQQPSSSHKSNTPTNFRAVPPPASLSVSGRGRGGSTLGVSRFQQPHLHQFQYQKPPIVAGAGSSSALVAAAAAHTKTTATATPTARPAYISIPSSSSKAKSQTPLNPQSWPPSVSKYVERAFKAAPMRQRTRLQEVLKIIINDAQDKGELFSRGWDVLPLPDLSLSAEDAAAIILEVGVAIEQNKGNPNISTTGSAAAPATAPASAAGPWRQSAPPRPAALHHAFQNQKINTNNNNTSSSSGGAARGMVSLVRSSFDPSPYNNNNNTSSSSQIIKKNRKRDRAENWQSDDDADDASQGGPFSADEDLRRRRRAGRFKEGDGDDGGDGGGGGHHHHNSAAARKAKLSALLEDAGGANGDAIDWDAFAIKGTSQTLEKSYFRLTSAPDPSTVRPEPVLRRALDRLVHLIASGEVNYFYVQDQFKGLRQDCVVQAIQGPLALAIYEAHGRAALEYGDVAEYNQCQGQMSALWAEGVRSEGGCKAEFLASRLLYQTVHARHGEHLALMNTLRQLQGQEQRAEAAQPEVVHALQVRAAVAAEEYALFFRLYATAPKLGRALMDLAVPRLRFAALNACVKAFKPSFPVEYVARLLGFVSSNNNNNNDDSKGGDGEKPLSGCVSAYFEGAHAAKGDDVGREECVQWLSECGAVVVSSQTENGDGLVVDCKASTGKLTMPPEKEKVAHGDANLDIGDFLKSFNDV